MEQGEGDEREDKKVAEFKHTFSSVTGTIRKHHTYRSLEVEVIGNKKYLGRSNLGEVIFSWQSFFLRPARTSRTIIG